MQGGIDVMTMFDVERNTQAAIVIVAALAGTFAALTVFPHLIYLLIQWQKLKLFRGQLEAVKPEDARIQFAWNGIRLYGWNREEMLYPLMQLGAALLVVPHRQYMILEFA